MPQNKKQLQFYIPGGTSTTEPTTPSVPKPAPVTNAQLQQSLDEELSSRFVKPVISSLGWVADQLSRGQYASAKFFDSNAGDAKTLLDSLSDAAKEFLNPQEKMSFSDLINKRDPQFAKDNPKSTAVIGFLADVALDPLSYLGVGLAKKGLTVGGKTLSKEGTKVLKTGLNLVKSEGRSVELADKVTSIQKFLKANNATLPDEEILNLAKKELDKDLQTIPDTFFKEKKRIAENTFKTENPELQQMLSSMDNNLFNNLSYGVKKGKSGLSIEKSADVAKVIERDSEGSPIGVLKIFLDANNNPIQQSIAVAKQRQGIGTRLWNFAKQNGYDIESVSGKSNYSKEGADFALARAKKKYVEPPSVGEIYETVEDRISRIAAIPQNEKLKLFEPEGLRLTVGVPLGKQYDVPGSRLVLKALGVDYLQDTIRNVGAKLAAVEKVTNPINKKQYANPLNTLGRTFVKEFDPTNKVPLEFWDRLHQIENTLDSTVDNVVRTTAQMTKKVAPERQEVFGQLMADIRDASYKKEEELGRALTQQEANEIKNVAITSAKLNADEFALVSQYYQDYAKMQELEMRAGLLNAEVTNYSPRSYELLKDATEMSDLVRNKGNSLSTNLSSSKRTKYATMAEAVADGYVPELNAAVLYANRLINSREKLAAAQFNESVRKIFDLGEGNHQLSRKEMNQLPKVVQSNIRMLGDAVYPSGMDDTFKNILSAIDTATRGFKRLSYGLKPNAAPRQVISNSMQSAMVQGIKAFKVFDPRAAVDAGMMLLEKTGNTTKLPPFYKKFFSKYAPAQADAVMAERIALDKIVGAERLDSFSNNFKLKSVLGQEYDGNYLRDTMLRDVVKGFDASGEHIATKVERALSRNTDSIVPVAKELAKFWRWPQLTEDYSRAMLYMNGLRMGYSEKESLKMVNKTLFDYSRGLSYIEKNVFKRLIPFYTFPRFAIPFVTKSLVTKPGNALTGEKLMRLMEKMMTKDSLTPAEQESIPGYIIEQPRVFSGFDKDGKAYFNIFNNMSPLDALSLLVHDKYGNIDYQRTMEKTVFAQITPYLKVPFELAAQKNFFTGQALEKAGKLGDVNESTMSAVIPDDMKELMGWENRINPQTGKAAVYVNPYLAHTSLSVVPALRTWVLDLSDQGLSPLERAMELLGGVKTNKIDLKESSELRTLSFKSELNRLKAKMKIANRKGSTSEYNKAYKDYQELMNAIQESNKVQGTIRGQGLNPTDVPQQEQQQ